MLRKELIGYEFNITTPNGCKLSILIENKPTKFPFYREMGLDVFTDKAPSKIVVLSYSELKDMRAAELKEYAKKHGIAGNTKKDILNDIRKGNK